MNASRIVGLGEPEIGGKKALFQPATIPKKREPATLPQSNKKQTTQAQAPKNVHITADITRQALQVILDLQRRHRLATGKALPKWKVISEALVLYGKTKQGEG